MTKAQRKKLERIDVENLSQRDQDILNLETQEAMQKYKMQKQAVYDRRYALNQKLKAAGKLTATVQKAQVSAPAQTQAPKRRGRPAKVKTEAIPPIEQATTSEQKEVPTVTQQLSTLSKPVELNFGTFSIKLNSFPGKIAVNPNTGAIEIDL